MLVCYHGFCSRAVAGASLSTVTGHLSSTISQIRENRRQSRNLIRAYAKKEKQFFCSYLLRALSQYRKSVDLLHVYCSALWILELQPHSPILGEKHLELFQVLDCKTCHGKHKLVVIVWRGATDPWVRNHRIASCRLLSALSNSWVGNDAFYLNWDNLCESKS